MLSFVFIFPHFDVLTGLEDTLPSSFDVLNTTLMQIHEAASELRDQGTPNQQLNEILVRMPVFSYIFFTKKLLFLFLSYTNHKSQIYYTNLQIERVNK